MSANEDSVYSSESAFADSISVRKTSTAQSKLRSIPYLATKRLFDILIGAAGTVATIPVIGVVKLVNIKNGDFAPVLYSQARIGKNGKKIKIYKIRSMIPNADEVLLELLENPKYREEWDQYQKLKDDPRVTKIGHFVRRTSLDEFPQFFNILRGDMSLVGPRPLIEGELDGHKGNHEVYESVKPGLTGWWGANGRSNVNYNERLQQEYYYIENQGLILDIKCIVKTAKSIIKKDGAK